MLGENTGWGVSMCSKGIKKRVPEKAILWSGRFSRRQVISGVDVRERSGAGLGRGEAETPYGLCGASDILCEALWHGWPSFIMPNQQVT